MKDQVTQFVSRCPTCQMYKRNKLKYGILPPKDAEAVPWQQLCVDLIGPYKIPINSPNKAWKKNKFNELWCITMIDPVTSWFEMVEIYNKTPMEIANIVEMTWLNRYPRPRNIIFDGGSEFKVDFKK